MKHYLNVCDVNGAMVEPVDVISFGSPCQDLSVAGKRKGLKHEENGDDETTRSGLFMEAVRIIKEMRKEDEFRQLRSGRANEFIRPRFAIWENVPGAFSSNGGQDFRTVLEELARVKDPEVSIPMPDNGRWKQAGEIVGDGWSIAWRTLDAQYHGVPQRRRRIFLVADFADQCAGEILFECEGLPGYPPKSREEGQGIARDIAEGIGRTGERECYGFDGYNQQLTGDVSKAITSSATDSDHVPCVVENRIKNPIYSIDDTKMGNTYIWEEQANTLAARDYKGPQCVVQPICISAHGFGEYEQMDAVGTLLKDQNTTIRSDTPLVLHPAYAMTTGEYMQPIEEATATLLSRDYKDPQIVCYSIDSETFNCGQEFARNLGISDEGISPTLVARGPSAVCYKDIKYIVRRLTPTECARLQGMPDMWCRLPQITEMPDEDYEFWKEAHRIHAEINGKAYKAKTKDQMIAWYNKLQIDGSEYKAYGNGMALPCVRVPVHGIAKHGAKTMASLFDGIGGFPLAGLLDGITTLWTSEIELFPIAVTLARFREFEKYGYFTFGMEEK